MKLKLEISPNLAALQILFSNLADALPESARSELAPLLEDASALLADTTAGIRESHVHDVQITKEAPNYRAD